MAQIIGTATNTLLTAGKSIGFKLGLESQLTASSFSAVEGVFYLTSDTRRLFIGLSDGNVAPVNQGVITVANLPDSATVGQFYYLTNGNVLATWNGTTWVQLNPDTYVSAVSNSVTGTTNNAAIKTSVTNAGGHGNTVTSANAINIKGAGDNTVSVNGRDITITSATYDLGTAAGGTNEAVINLTKGTANTVAGSVTVKGSTGIAVSQANDVITIDATGLSNSAADSQIKSAAFAPQADGFKLTLTKQGGSTVTADLKPSIKYGKTENTVQFASGVADLDVYTISEVDALLNSKLMNVNAMTYKGTAGSTESTTKGALPTSGVAIGDVYMSDGGGSITAGGQSKIWDAGTLFIATGTETNGVITSDLTWTVVQNYNTDTQTSVTPTVSATNGSKQGITLYNNAGGAKTEIGGITVKSGTTNVLTITGAKSGTDNTTCDVTISHAVSGYKATEATVPSQDNTKQLFVGKALGAITADTYGHLKTSTEELIQVPTEVFTSTSIKDAVTVATSGTTTTATLKHSLSLKNASNNATISTAQVSSQIASDTLEVKVSGDAVAMNLVWGSF